MLHLAHELQLPPAIPAHAWHAVTSLCKRQPPALGSESWRLRPCHLQVTGSHAEQGGMHCRHSVMAGLRQGGGSRVQMDGVVHSAGQPHLAEVRK